MVGSSLLLNSQTTGESGSVLLGYENYRARQAWVPVTSYIALILDQGPVALGTIGGLFQAGCALKSYDSEIRRLPPICSFTSS